MAKKRRKKSTGGLPAKGRLADIADELWSLAVKNQWGHQCAVCDKRGALNSHHLVPRQHESTRYLVRNGICLCVHCHQFDPDLSPHQNAAGWLAWLEVHHRAIYVWYIEHRRSTPFDGLKNADYYIDTIESLMDFVSWEDFSRIVGKKFAATFDDVDSEIEF